ncbi:MAG: hypothetical protein AAB574_02270 [Patescibacteria group bacterium]
MNDRYINTIEKWDEKARELAAQAAIPDSPVARALTPYLTAKNPNLEPSIKTFLIDLKAGLSGVGFQCRYGVHPQAVIDAKKTTTTSPDGA